MKAIIEFTLPEEREEHRLALDGGAWMCAVHDLDELLRTTIKYTDIRTVEIEAVRKKLYEILAARSLNLD